MRRGPTEGTSVKLSESWLKGKTYVPTKGGYISSPRFPQVSVMYRSALGKGGPEDAKLGFGFPCKLPDSGGFQNGARLKLILQSVSSETARCASGSQAVPGIHDQFSQLGGFRFSAWAFSKRNL